MSHKAPTQRGSILALMFFCHHLGILKHFLHRQPCIFILHWALEIMYLILLITFPSVTQLLLLTVWSCGPDPEVKDIRWGSSGVGPRKAGLTTPIMLWLLLLPPLS